MNIFILDQNVELSAQWHVDRHIVKMPLEMAQMLCTNLYVLNGMTSKAQSFRQEDKVQEIFKNFPKRKENSTRVRDYYMIYNPKHPCTIWLRESVENCKYGLHLFSELLKEYQFRYRRSGILREVCEWMKENYDFSLFNKVELTPFAQALPEELKSDDAVESYRKYYIRDKSHIAKWTDRESPEWWINNR